jgi:hypothetical protein
MEHDLIDEYRLMIHPVSWARECGFPRRERHEDSETRGCKPLGPDVLNLTYHPAR